MAQVLKIWGQRNRGCIDVEHEIVNFASSNAQVAPVVVDRVPMKPCRSLGNCNFANGRCCSSVCHLHQIVDYDCLRPCSWLWQRRLSCPLTRDDGRPIYVQMKVDLAEGPGEGGKKHKRKHVNGGSVRRQSEHVQGWRCPPSLRYLTSTKPCSIALRCGSHHPFKLACGVATSLYVPFTSALLRVLVRDVYSTLFVRPTNQSNKSHAAGHQ